MYRIRRRGHLRLAHACRGVRDLALQVGQVHRIVVYQRETPHACSAEQQRHGGAQPPRADHQGVGCQDALLSFDADFIEQDVARVAQQLVIVHGIPECKRPGCKSLFTIFS